MWQEGLYKKARELVPEKAVCYLNDLGEEDIKCDLGTHITM